MPRSAYAGLVSRLAALGTDLSLLVVVGLAIDTVPTLVWRQVVVNPTPDWLSAISTAFAALLPWSYFTVSWWLSGQTVGNRLFGIAVQHPDGRAPSLPRSAGRAAAGLLLPPLWIIGLLAVLWDERRRAWHDRVFGTVVRYSGR